jgi:drug/metabolite transporter (DMT)-like permease
MSLRSLGGDLPFVYVAAAVGGAIAAAESSVVVKGFPRAQPVPTNAVGMAAGALLLWIASLLVSESWTVPQQARTWAALSWLVVAGSVGLFYLFLFVIGHWTASATVYSLTLMPVVAVTLGALLASEPVTPEVVAGAALVVLAVYVGAVRPAGRQRAAATPATVAGEG